jgi:cystathionine beta-lyase
MATGTLHAQENPDWRPIMKFDFDRVIDLRNTHSAKWDRLAAGTLYKTTGPSGTTAATDAIPMWVADMDFAVPPPVTQALAEEVNRSVHGYYDSPATWHEAQCDWLERRHGWRPEKSWISVTPGIVSGLGLVLQALTEPGDEVIVFSPAYHAFRYIIEANGRKIFNVPMREEQGRYRIDLPALADRITPRGKIVFFCSPHNPGGRVWERDEIRAVVNFCIERDLYLVSDEAHADLVHDGRKHNPTIVAAPEAKDRLVTCVGVTKTFNLAGANTTAVIASNPAIKAKIDARIFASGLQSGNRFGLIATEAAMRGGDEWLEAVLPYLRANRDRFAAGIAKAIPGARAMHVEATYLAWVDFSGTSLKQDDYMERITQRARIGVSPGPQFGPGGESFIRFNFATPRQRIDEALERLADAFAT